MVKIIVALNPVARFHWLAEIRIPLSVGINNIELVVASTGTSGGNTAEIHFLDDKKSSITKEYWNNLALGVKIKTIVVRK